MMSKRYGILWLVLALMLVNAPSCQHEEKPGLTETWSDEPHVDSALADHFSVLRKAMFSYCSDTLYSTVVFFENLTGIAGSHDLGTFGITYYSSGYMIHDYQEWRSWCRMNREGLVWDSVNSSVVFGSDSAQ